MTKPRSRSGLRMAFLVARQTVIRDLIPRRPRGDEGVELRADAGLAVERAEADRNFFTLRPLRAEQARAADRAEGLHASAIRPKDADQFLTGEQGGTPRAGRVLAFRRKRPSAFGTASSGSDSPSERAPSPRSGRGRRGTSRGAGPRGSAQPVNQYGRRRPARRNRLSRSEHRAVVCLAVLSLERSRG